MTDTKYPHDAYAGYASAGNNLRVHLIARTVSDEHHVAQCGAYIPRRPQATQEPLRKCERCF